MKNLEWKKVLLLLGLIVYLSLGTLLACVGTGITEHQPSTGQKVALNSDMVFRQRIVGNDYFIKKASFGIKAEGVTSDGVLIVYLKKMGEDGQSSIVCGEVELSGTDLQKKEEISVSFPYTRLVYDRDYYIEFCFTDSNPDAFIWFETNSDGYGLENENGDYGIALSYDIDYHSPKSRMLFVWSVLLMFGLSTVTVCLINRVMFWEANAAVCLFSVACIYLCGLFGILKWGYYVLVAAAVLMIFLLMRFIAQRSWTELKSLWGRYIHGALLCWGILLILYFVADQGKMIQYWDELRHWAVAAKDMYLFDSFPAHQNTAVELVRYPPAYTAFQYLALQMYGRFSESILHLAKHILMMALLMGCMENCDESTGRRKLPLVVMGIFCIGIPQLFFPRFVMDSIINDEIVGCAFAYVLIHLKKVVEKGSVFNILTFSGGILLCILSKDTGLVAVLITLCAIACILVSLRIKLKIWDKRWIIGGCVLAVTTVVGELSWQLYLRFKTGIEIEKAGDSFVGKSIDTVTATGLRGNAVLDFFSGRAASYKYEAFPIYIKRIFLGGDYPNSIFTASILLWMFLICFSLFLVMCKTKKIDKVWLALNILIGLGTIAAYLLLYIFTFPEEDTRAFVSLNRYLAGHLLAMSFLTVFTFSQALGDGRRRRYWGVNLCLCVVLLVLTAGCSYYRSWFTGDKQVVGEIDEEVIEKGKLLREKLKETDLLYYISKDNPGARYQTTKYYCIPIRFNPRVNNGKRSYYPVIKEPRIEDYQITEQEWREVLSHYDYLYIETCDSKFADAYQGLFEDSTDIGDGILYSIDKKESKLLRYYTSICP